jgi:hypothetical protein
MLKYFISILLLSLSFQSFSQDDDSAAVKPFTDSMGLLRFSMDISKPILNSFSDKRKSYEFEVIYYWKKSIYVVAEGGFGSSQMDDTLLKYSSANSFYKIGLNKSMLGRSGANDWDMAFIGFRYALAPIKRSDAFYKTYDNFWGNTSGTIPGDNMTAHWMEICSGVQLELYKGIFAGWTVSAKFLMNKKEFQELPPSYIAGYGKGDNNTIFDFNFYVGYSIKWKKRSQHTGADTAAPK